MDSKIARRLHIRVEEVEMSQRKVVEGETEPPCASTCWPVRRQKLLKLCSVLWRSLGHEFMIEGGCLKVFLARFVTVREGDASTMSTTS